MIQYIFFSQPSTVVLGWLRVFFFNEQFGCTLLEMDNATSGVSAGNGFHVLHGIKFVARRSALTV